MLVCNIHLTGWRQCYHSEERKRDLASLTSNEFPDYSIQAIDTVVFSTVAKDLDFCGHCRDYKSSVDLEIYRPIY